MPPHPYVRAYMAGLVAPTLIVALVALVVASVYTHIAPEVERAMIFPMAINPAAWGAWNALRVRLRPERRLPIGWHGAVLPLILIPAGLAFASGLSIHFVTVRGALLVTPPVAVAYYLLWRYVVSFFNKLLGIANHRERRGAGNT